MNFSIFKEAFSQWNKDKVPMLSAAISYYAVFSAAPLLLIAVSITGLFLGTSSVKYQIVYEAQLYFGPQTAEVIRGLIEDTSISSNNIIATIVGIIILFIGSSGVLGQLKDALNDIFDADVKTHKGLMHLLTDKSSTFIMVLLIGFFLLIFLLLSIIISILSPYLEHIFRYPAIMIYALNFIVSISIISTVFSFIYIVLPDKKMPWKNVWRGALFSAILFMIGKEIISFYIRHFSGASTYGAAGSLVIILLWIFFSTQIFLYGAELIKCMPAHK